MYIIEKEYVYVFDRSSHENLHPCMCTCILIYYDLESIINTHFNTYL